MAFVVSGQIGVNLDLVTSVPQYSLGTLVSTNDGGIYQYVQAASTVSQYAAVAIFAGNTVRMLETSIVTAAGELQSRVAGFAQASMASAFYGWVARCGKVIVNVADDCAAGAMLFTTSTAGVLDDATVSGGLVLGVQLTTTSSLATAMTALAGQQAIVFTYQNPA
jgi:hypothetical protein